MLNSLPDIQGFGERIFQFDVKISTKLWKALSRRRKLATDNCTATCLELSQARPDSDITTTFFGDEIDLDFLNDSSDVRRAMPGAVYISPVEPELFDRFDLRVLRGVVVFRSPDIINFNIVLSGVGGSFIEAVFDVSRFLAPAERPSGVLVSYIINV